ncbi:hypothetical protein QBC44DRAFT_367569 [Cladorrhinum sp. PSN332]|nr:hypothetical protein QBC44DRAFT_367569 [Cladorrhinum sp. PSN332]
MSHSTMKKDNQNRAVATQGTNATKRRVSSVESPGMPPPAKRAESSELSSHAAELSALKEEIKFMQSKIRGLQKDSAEKSQTNLQHLEVIGALRSELKTSQPNKTKAASGKNKSVSSLSAELESTKSEFAKQQKINEGLEQAKNIFRQNWTKASTEVKKLQAQLDHDDGTNLESALNKATAENANLAARNEILSKELDLVNNNRKEDASIIAYLKEGMVRLHENNAELKAQNLALDKKTADLAKNNAELEKEARAAEEIKTRNVVLQVEAANLSKTISDMKSDANIALANAKHRNVTVKGSITNLEKKVAQLEGLIAAHKDQIQQTKDQCEQTVRRMNEQLLVVDRDRKNATALLQNSKVRLEEADYARKEEKNQLDKIKILESKVTQKEALVKQQKDEMKMLRAEKAQYQREIRALKPKKTKKGDEATASGR